MIRYVLDASVALKWLVPDEDLTEEAFRLRERYATGEIVFIVPDIFWAEIGNSLWKGMRQLRWSAETAESAARSLAEQAFPTASSKSLFRLALDLAIKQERSLNDSLYVALALQHSSQLVTADERLANALAARFPVKWLGALGAD